MTTMKRLLAAIAFVSAGAAFAQMTPVGVWQSVDDKTGEAKSQIRIAESGGVLNGRIEKLLRKEAKQDAVCDECTDDRKDKPLVGMTLIKGVKASASDKAMWDGGEIMDPNNGKTYKVRLTPGDGGKTLAVRGYIGAPMLGRTQTWLRVE